MEENTVFGSLKRRDLVVGCTMLYLKLVITWMCSISFFVLDEYTTALSFSVDLIGSSFDNINDASFGNLKVITCCRNCCF